MKKAPKLSRYISIALGLITIVMIGVYSLLVQFSLFTGMEDTISYAFRLEARDFAREYEKNPNTQLPEDNYMKSYIGEKNLPIWLKNYTQPELLPHATIEADELTDKAFNNGDAFFFMVFPYDLPDGNRLYMVETYREQDEIEGTFQKSDRAEILSLVLGIGFIILIFFTLRYLFKKVSSPVENLLTWAGNMNQASLKHAHPDFKFKEINHLADLIEGAVSDLHLALNREHNFLRNASHELRTPIAILKTNIDLLERLRSTPEKAEKISHERIRRAVDNMQSLTETLLWLSRKEETMPEPEPVRIDEMIKELVKENQYLLTGKNVVLTLKTKPFQVTLPKAALRIVLSNLIRNAFQYTIQGQVTIEVSLAAVSVVNENQAAQVSQTSENDYGFGLGLILVEQTCEKLNLVYKTSSISDGYRTSLFF